MPIEKLFLFFICVLSSVSVAVKLSKLCLNAHDVNYVARYRYLTVRDVNYIANYLYLIAQDLNYVASYLFITAHNVDYIANY